MNLKFERADKEQTTVEWITPDYYVEALSKDVGFDLDPCASHFQQKRHAQNNFYIEDDGLNKDWSLRGLPTRVFCNPPYGKVAEKFIRKLAEHGNGIALIFARPDAKVWHESIFPKAHAILFTEGRIAFHREGKKATQSGGSGSAFVAYGENNAIALMKSGIKGYFVRLRWDYNKTKRTL
jgi:phage N-6-adenine-methyltransferase